MKPVDPRLLHHARATRTFLAASVALGTLGAGLVIAQAVLIAGIVVDSFHHGAAPAALTGDLVLLATVGLGRALVSWLTGLAAHRAGAAVKSELRTRLLERAAALGPSRLGEQRTGELTTLATRGIDALDGYFARYLPQLALALIVPIAVLARIVTADWLSALIIILTLPLIPLFMVLIGWATRAHTDRQWLLLSRLSGHFLDVVAGLPTLKVFGRARAQAESIRAITAEYRRATLRTLRIAFLSAFVLELLATLSVALVAVGIGMRLVHGELDLYTGLMILILAPEAYVPLRQVGTQYHAAAEGLAAADQVFAVLQTPHHRGTTPAPDLRTATITLDRLTVRHPGRRDASLPETGLTLRPGETLALTGPSGAGKTTLLNALLGFVTPTSGRILADGTGLGTIDQAGWHAQIAWVSQHPYLFAGTVADNVRLARPDADRTAVLAALDSAAAEDIDPDLVLGEGGSGLSAGQRQRLALARAFLADRPLLLLDEPTAALDGATEAAVTDAIRRLATGRTVLLVAHRPALLTLADRVVRLPGPADASAARSISHSPDRFASPDAAGAGTAGTMPPGGDLPAQRRSEEAEPEADPVGTAGVRRYPAGAAGTPRAAGAARSPAVSVGTAGAVHGLERHPAVRRSAPADGTHRAGPHGPRASDAAPVSPAAGPLTRVRRTATRLRPRFALALLLGALALASAIGLMAVSGWLISRASQQPPVLYLMVAVTATRAFGIGRAVFRYAERLVSHDAVLRVLADLRVAVYRRLERLSPAGLRTTRRGDLLTRLVADVDTLQDYFLRWLLPVAVAAAVGAATVGFTAYLLPAAGAALAIGLLTAGVAVPALTAAVARRTEAALAPARSTLATRALDLLTGTAELTVAGALPQRAAAVRAADRRLTALAARSAAATALGGGLSALAAGLTVTAAAWLGVRAVYSGELPGLWLAVVVLTPLAAFEAVAGLPEAVQHRQRVRRSAQRLYEVLDARPPVREPDGEPHREHGAVPGRAADEAAASPAGSAPFAAPVSLTLRAVTARHPGTAPDARPALERLDLDLVPGRRIAVVGPSGSGKTTLAQVLLRFLDPESGMYTLGGRDATALPGDTVRRTVGLCAQDAHVFDSSLRENLRLAKPAAGDDELRSALAAARLLGWVDTLPDGLETMVGERGSRLSGGQRQRLALARALLADFPVLILDEPAEHLDLPTADALTADLLVATRGRTTVLITHRLAGLDDTAVDEVIVLDAGRAVQRGRYAELAAVDGPFRRMLAREARTAEARTAEQPATAAGG